MKIALSSQGMTKESALDTRFGRAAFFVMFEKENDVWSVLDNKQNLQASQGAGIQAAAHVVNAGCTHLVTGHCGPKAFTVLQKAGVKVYKAAGETVEAAVQKCLRGECEQMITADVDAHW